MFIALSSSSIMEMLQKQYNLGRSVKFCLSFIVQMTKKIMQTCILYKIAHEYKRRDSFSLSLLSIFYFNSVHSFISFFLSLLIDDFIFFLFSYRLVITLWTLPALSQFQQHMSLKSYRAVTSMWLLAGLSMLMGHQTVSPGVVFFLRTRFPGENSLNFCATVGCPAWTQKPQSNFEPYLAHPLGVKFQPFNKPIQVLDAVGKSHYAIPEKSPRL